MNNKNVNQVSETKALLMLEYLKTTHQYFCFTDYGSFFTAEELLARLKGRKVTSEEVIEYLTA